MNQTKTFGKKGLTKKSENLSEWYHDVVVRAELADYSEVKGSMIIRPLGYALWERTQAILDAWFKEDGVQNVYFPLFIPMHLLEKEKKHVEGFSPELAVVTHAGGEKLAEPLAVRPTSETIMYRTFADWIQSYRQLPFKVNQWCNIVRWEKRTYPFLRTSEFLWQEGHTAHANEADAVAMTLKALQWYKSFYEDHFAVSPYIGLKSESEKFAGAKMTYSVEIVVPDGKALQAATSHLLGDTFAKVFEVSFLDEQGERKFVQQTSWGLSTRSIGGLILVHGDDAGLILPPRVAPTQVVVMAVGGKGDVSSVDAEAATVVGELKAAGMRVTLDTDTEHSLGFRINEHELRGTPLRLEIGKRDIEAGTVLSVRRDTLKKEPLSRDGLPSSVLRVLESIQNDMRTASQHSREQLTVDMDDYDEFKETMALSKRFVRALWCEEAACEASVKEETKATPRVLELDRIDENVKGKCIACGKPAHRHWLFAQSY